MIAANLSRIVAHPNQKDILCGKQKHCLRHEGSRRFRQLLESFQSEYKTLTTKQEKANLTKAIFVTVKRTSARFLKFNEESNCWEEINEVAARDKISHALRHLKPRRKKGQQQPEQLSEEKAPLTRGGKKDDSHPSSDSLSKDSITSSSDSSDSSYSPSFSALHGSAVLPKSKSSASPTALASTVAVGPSLPPILPRPLVAGGEARAVKTDSGVVQSDNDPQKSHPAVFQDSNLPCVALQRLGEVARLASLYQSRMCQSVAPTAVDLLVARMILESKQVKDPNFSRAGAFQL